MTYMESFEDTATEHDWKLPGIVEQMLAGQQVEFMGKGVKSWIQINISALEEEPCVPNCPIVLKK